jgi:hypothetical protein
MVDVPVKDMEAWVKRPIEDRLAEAEKRNGYITRPMNSFMLYRSAYAERTKMWCLHNNHQVVSSVSGESWPLEPMEVREFYNELAKIERVNHQNAHPNYKFSPSKPGGAANNKKRPRPDEDDESEPSDLDDPDWGRENGMRNRPAKRLGRDAGYPARANLGDAQGHFHEVYNRTPSWELLTHPPPQQVSSMPYQRMPYPQQFYPSPTMQHHSLQMASTPQHQQADPFASFNDTSFPTNQSLIGMPGGNHAELLGLQPTTAPSGFDQVDPLLMSFHDEAAAHVQLQHDDPFAFSQHGSSYDPHSFEQHALAYPTDGAGGPLITDYRPKEWVPDSTSPAFEPGSGEFDALWDEHEKNEAEGRKASLRNQFEEGGLVGGAVQAVQAGEEELKSPRSH